MIGKEGVIDFILLQNHSISWLFALKHLYDRYYYVLIKFHHISCHLNKAFCCCRYQLLHVLSKEVINRWQGLVEDHRSYQEKLAETQAWLQPLESQLETLRTTAATDRYDFESIVFL